MNTLALFRNEAGTRPRLSRYELGEVFKSNSARERPRASLGTVRCSTFGKSVVPVTAPRFRALVKESPDFALEIMGLMAARLRSMDKRL